MLLERSSPTLEGWTTDAFRISHSEAPPHTLLVFVPGNPGLAEWYIPLFGQIVESLGPGYEARGVSNAGHALDLPKTVPRSDSMKDIAWTIVGQAKHKCAFVDVILKEYSRPPSNLVMVGHSIGVKLIHEMLRMRPDILRRTRLLLAITPFIRMDPPFAMNQVFQTLLKFPETVVSSADRIFATMAMLPLGVVRLLTRVSASDPHSAEVTAKLLQRPEFVSNFFELGRREITQLPKSVDSRMLRTIGHQCPTTIICARNDHWYPKEHMHQLQMMKEAHQVPENLTLVYKPQLQHDFVVRSEQIVIVSKICIEAMKKLEAQPMSRL